MDGLRVFARSGTSFKFLGYDSLVIRPRPNVAMTEFQGLGEAGASYMLQGYLTEMGELQHSKQGRPMRAGKLVEPSGVALPVMFHGSHVQDPDWRDHTLVTVFFATSQEGLQNAVAMFF